MITELYHVNDIVPNMIPLSFLVVFIFINFPVIFILDRFGIGCPLIFAGFCTLIGTWVRYFVIPTRNFYWVLAGSFVQGIG